MLINMGTPKSVILGRGGATVRSCDYFIIKIVAGLLSPRRRGDRTKFLLRKTFTACRPNADAFGTRLRTFSLQNSNPYCFVSVKAFLRFKSCFISMQKNKGYHFGILYFLVEVTGLEPAASWSQRRKEQYIPLVSNANHYI